ncbi:MAG: Gfo/Idh/MocA family oxidoreductase [Phycisphaeraceae bacterium]|nr:Gfo/Idh/MocA family oxidoreductase [Phycisphaeraceae bacterium]
MSNQGSHVKQHRILVVGTGSIGERHVRCFLQTGRASVGIVEPADKVRQVVADRYPLLGAYADLDQALHDGHWTSAVICTPAPMHVQQAIQCLDCSISTLIEKPLAVASAQAAALLGRDDHGLAIGVAYVYRAHPGIAAMRQELQSGRFGRPLQLTLVSGQHFPTYRPAYASTYYTRHETGGGAIQDALTHMFNTAEWLVGPITRIAADAGHCKLEHVQVEDTVNCIARHDQVMASYSLNQHQPANENTLTVICQRGMVRFEGHNNRWRWQSDPACQWTDCPVPTPTRDSWFIMQAAAWLDALEGKHPVLCSLEEGMQTLVVNEAALRSAGSGSCWQDVTVPSPNAAERSIDVGA